MSVLGIVSSALQALLMGVIGYPLAKRRPGGMAAFQRSGFTWWLITLALVVAAALAVAPSLLAPMAPSAHDPAPLRLLGVLVAGTLAVLIVELVTDRLLLGAKDSAARSAARQRYEGALPRWGVGGGREFAVLAGTAVLEEAVFRAIGMGGLLTAWDASKPLAAGLTAVAFGLAHWYYGPGTVAVKIIDGSAFAWMALGGGWLIAAAGHVLVNIVLTILSPVAESSRPVPATG